MNNMIGVLQQAGTAYPSTTPVPCLVCPVLPVFLNCPFLIAPSVFSNAYLLPIVCPVSCVTNVFSVSGLIGSFIR
jgi:hypothetical protein